jgi:ABC-type multidrug transport system ATPase subunit/ABC-type multidrug transport system permease subunit
MSQFSIGKSPDNDLVIPNPHISRYHCQLQKTPQGVLLEDLKSTNGTFVNGVRLYRSTFVNTSDKIELSNEIILDWFQPALAAWMGDEDFGRENQDENLQFMPSASLSFNLGSYGKSVLTIGRSPESDIVVSHPRVSRNQAVARKQSDGKWLLEDLSVNGTFVDGRRISKTVISDRSIVFFAGLPVVLSVSGKARSDDPVDLDRLPGDARIEIEGLSFDVRDGSRTRRILNNITMTIEPGEFVGLIGPSGSGKTTLMLLLNGYNRPSSGQVRLNSINLHRQPDLFKGFVGYVPQDDIIHRELTVMRSLLYNARLRLPDMDDSERTRLVLKVISELGLGKAMNVAIGTAEKKGISGGQRKKVNLAQELLTEPSVLLLDEPCSGLDPKSERDVMLLLRKLSRSGKTIILTTHGIMERNFRMLDKLIVLGEGGVLAYFGPADKATSFFGVKEPEEIFDALQDIGSEAWHSEYEKSHYAQDATEENHKGESSVLFVPKPQKSNLLMQLLVLCTRYAEVKWRDKLLTLILLAQAPLIGGLLALGFGSSESIGASTPMFILIIAAAWLGVSNAAREVVSERAIYKRESMVFLAPGNYMLSKFLILAVFEAMQCLILLSVCRDACGLMGDFWSGYFLILLVSIASTALGLLISSLSSSEAQAMALVPMFLIPQVIFGGVLIPLKIMSPVIKIISGTMLVRWGFEVGLLIEDNSVRCASVDSLGLSRGNIMIDIIIIIAWAAVYTYLTYRLLKKVNK